MINKFVAFKVTFQALNKYTLLTLTSSLPSQRNYNSYDSHDSLSKDIEKKVLHQINLNSSPPPTAGSESGKPEPGRGDIRLDPSLWPFDRRDRDSRPPPERFIERKAFSKEKWLPRRQGNAWGRREGKRGGKKRRRGGRRRRGEDLVEREEVRNG